MGLVPKTPEHDEMCNAKCREVNLYREMACVEFSGIYSPRSQGPLCTGILIPIADGSLVVGIKNSDTKRPGGGGEKNHKLKFRGPISTDFCRFLAVWAFLLKIQSAITPSILGVRDSSLDSKKLSPIPFNNMQK